METNHPDFYDDDLRGCAEEPEGWGEPGERRPHDPIWKALFQCAAMMESFIRDFAELEIVAELDLSRLERRSGEYVARRLRTLRGDIVWRAPWRNAPGHLYFPVELQSRPIPGMPRRMTEYVAQLHQAADPGEPLPGSLPPSYPTVVCTQGRWTAEPALEPARILKGCPERAAAVLERYQPRLRFRLISLEDMDDADLARRPGIAAHVFRLARARSLKELESVLMPLLRRLAAPELAELREPVMNLLRHVVLPRLKIRDERMNGTFEEVSAVAQVVFDDWKEEYRAEGRIEGEARGHARGFIEGEARGEAKGRWEEKLENALGMLRENVSVESIARGLGLSLEKVRELAAGLKKD